MENITVNTIIDNYNVEHSIINSTKFIDDDYDIVYTDKLFKPDIFYKSILTNIFTDEVSIKYAKYYKDYDIGQTDAINTVKESNEYEGIYQPCNIGELICIVKFYKPLLSLISIYYYYRNHINNEILLNKLLERHNTIVKNTNTYIKSYDSERDTNSIDYSFLTNYFKNNECNLNKINSRSDIFNRIANKFLLHTHNYTYNCAVLNPSKQNVYSYFKFKNIAKIFIDIFNCNT